ncbi:apolipoprotein N-acyltransferase [Neorhodopirellula pilleata]|nr:apolipoprotein N-acyltransferase [Neorhodopirellula pilleata]
MTEKRSSRVIGITTLASAVLLYLTGPGINLWPLAFVALVPLIQLARDERLSARSGVKWKRIVYSVFVGYYLASLQGLRHAHPLMFVPLTAMAAYLAIYPLLFVVLLRRHDHPLTAAALWVGGEWVRNYFATGISVLMLGHTLVDMPGGWLIQIADLQGTYAVSFLIVIVNYAIADAVSAYQGTPARWIRSTSMAAVFLITSGLYGNHRLSYPVTPSDTRILLVGRDEQTEYQQDLGREQEIFNRYASQTIDAIANSDVPIDAVVWPESMFSGGQPWIIADAELTVPEEAGGEKFRFTESQFREIIADTQRQFVRRSINLQAAMTPLNEGDAFPPPSIIGGCGVVRYGRTAKQYSGVLHVDPSGQVEGVYAKNHLVMFGEYIPLIRSIPILRDHVPPGLGLDAGDGPNVFNVGGLKLLPNLCIETAVERIAVNHLHERPEANAIVTLTNDAWFDHTAVVSHHLRCAQMVAIGTRRPVLSAANGGPTAWIDSFGKIVEKVPLDEAGQIMTTPGLDDRRTLYVRVGSWPTAIAGGWFIAMLAMMIRRDPTRDQP